MLEDVHLGLHPPTRREALVRAAGTPASQSRRPRAGHQNSPALEARLFLAGLLALPGLLPAPAGRLSGAAAPRKPHGPLLPAHTAATERPAAAG